MGAMNIITLDDNRDFLVWRDGSGCTVEIFDIAIGSERRKGQGRKLIQALFALHPGKHVWAITRRENEIAQQFYEALGFRVVGNLRQFYGDAIGVDAIMYGRSSEGSV